MRPFQETITWLTFKTELHQAPPSFWLTLGECVAGLRHLSNIPLPVSEARSVERYVHAGGLQARLAMDGISVPLDTIRTLLQNPGNPSAVGTGCHEVAALFRAWQTQKGYASNPGESAFDPVWIKKVHTAVVGGTDDDDRPGHWRVLPVGGRPWEGVPPEVIGLFIEDLGDWLNSPELKAPSADEEGSYALVRMLLAELYLSWIHPFNGGHFRMAGVVGSTVLAGSGLTTVCSHLVSIGFNKNAREFQRQVQHATEGVADPIPFLAFGLRVLAEELRDLHARIRDLQIRGQWRAQLLDLFQEANDEPTRRQRQVLLDLADHDLPVQLGKLTTVSPTLARLYAGVSAKTLRRDVDALLTAGVLLRSSDGLRVHLGNILAFKP